MTNLQSTPFQRAVENASLQARRETANRRPGAPFALAMIADGHEALGTFALAAAYFNLAADNSHSSKNVETFISNQERCLAKLRAELDAAAGSAA